MYLYMPGFRATCKSYKSGLFKGHFKENIFISNHPVQPQKAIAYLENIISEENIKGIIASSLAGYYATYLSEKHNLKAVLINPSVKPYTTTRKYLGLNTKTNGEEFIWKEKHLEELEKLKVEKPTLKNYLLLLQSGDNVLDYKVALNFYNGCKTIVEDGGNHGFEGLDRHLDKITLFLNH